MTVKKILIYPYSKMHEPVIRFSEFILDYEVEEIISPPGWGLIGKEVYSKKRNYIISDDFTSALEKCDVVWFVEDEILELPRSVLNEKILQSIQYNKQIIYTRDYSAEIIKLIPEELNITPQSISEMKYEGESGLILLDQVKPIVFVAGTSPNTDKYAMQLALVAGMRKKGYRVSAVTSRQGSEVLGLHSIPEFMFDSSVSIHEKILRYNHLIKQIEIQENPDVIIIGIPGGVIPYSKKIHNDYGIIAFQIFHAVDCDCGIFCSLYGLYDEEYFDRIESLIKNKYGVSIDYHHVSSVMLDSSTQNRYIDKGIYLTLDKNYTEKIIKEKMNFTYDMYCEKDMDILIDKIEFQLTG